MIHILTHLNRILSFLFTFTWGEGEGCAVVEFMSRSEDNFAEILSFYNLGPGD